MSSNSTSDKRQRSRGRSSKTKRKPKSILESEATKGDIIEFTLSPPETENKKRLWGIYIGLDRVVYVSDAVTTKVERANKFNWPGLSLINSKKGIVNIDMLKDLTGDLKNWQINNSISSHWNSFSRAGRPELIVERAIVQIGRKTSLSSRDFVLYCRYGSNTKFGLMIVSIVIIAFAVYQEEVQGKIKIFIRLHHMKLFLLFYFIFSVYFVLSIWTYLSNEPLEKKTWGTVNLITTAIAKLFNYKKMLIGNQKGKKKAVSLHYFNKSIGCIQKPLNHRVLAAQNQTQLSYIQDSIY